MNVVIHQLFCKHVERHTFYVICWDEKMQIGEWVDKDVARRIWAQITGVKDAVT